MLELRLLRLLRLTAERDGVRSLRQAHVRVLEARHGRLDVRRLGAQLGVEVAAGDEVRNADAEQMAAAEVVGEPGVRLDLADARRAARAAAAAAAAVAEAPTLPEFYERSTEAERAQADATAAATAAHQAQDAIQPVQPVQPIGATVRTSSGAAATVRMRWTFEVTDLTAVPRAFLTLDATKVREAIRASVKATEKAPSIPGIRVYQEPDVAVSA